MRIKMLKTVRADGKNKPPEKLAKLLERSGFVVLLEGFEYSTPQSLGAALTDPKAKPKLAKEV